jgi:hypothetical protein
LILWERQARFRPVFKGFEHGYGDGKRMFVSGSGKGKLTSDVVDLVAFNLIY